MSLTQRLTSVTVTEDPEDFLGESLGIIFTDDVTTQHGDAANALRYTSPHLPKPLHIRLADPDTEDERRLFSHYLWNASLLLAEFVEAGSLGLKLDKPLGCGATTTAPPCRASWPPSWARPASPRPTTRRRPS
ncbi:hypothetical protein G7054_g9127 [Neopestalotiopsis clavispora]|nr:hypothetical protein G7054_g9127 [Neopestalotiopsis clavispora]